MKKIKKIFKNKVAWLLVGALLVGFGGTVLYLSKTDNNKKEDQKKETAANNNDTNIQKDKGGGLPAPDTTTKAPAPVQGKAPTSDSTSLGSLATSVTAQKNPSDGSIDILFYLESSGTFTSQEKSGSSWVTVKENQNYAGHNGFLAGSIPVDQASKTMRVLKIENGKYTAVTKEFTISRAEVAAAGGIKTYN